MKRIHILLIILTLFTFNSYACEEEKKKPDCTKDSEFIWNPSNQNTTLRLNRFYELDKLINEQFQNGNYIKSKELISEYLSLAEVYNNNWNYGNAIHDANRILGLIHYNQRQVDIAAEYLIKSSQSTGSPQLNTFGPEMDLANLLLQDGRVEEVEVYLNGIKKFWKMDSGVVNNWLQQISKGGKPKLNRFGSHHMTWWQEAINWFGLLWPLIAAVAIYFKYRNVLLHWKFIPASIVIAYVTMIIGGIFSNLLMVPLIEVVSTSFITVVLVVVTFISQFILPVAIIYWFSKLEFCHAKNS
ncbi:MAG: hypothetical protein QM500_21730 [Methylococcales bacterium]